MEVILFFFRDGVLNHLLFIKEQKKNGFNQK